MPSYSILIVDDEANQRLILSQALRPLTEELHISTAGSVDEALHILEEHEPDLIITDYNMPLHTGLDLITHIRSRHSTARVIMITAYSSPELMHAVHRLGVDHYLMKPVSLQTLRRLALDLLAGIRPAARAAAS
ncbi:MAG TPA: response regulator [Roseiflexaceae bacterium]|nr:response regulator [Roseiflexaceae bacterium]HMP42952.1 response regulator [Roseiflexaceae bacterium]